MSEKRRDNKKRILRNGECQRKDGRYMYTYVGSNGKPQNLYSWKLESTDPLPQGKRPCIALRELEKDVQRKMDDGIVPYGGDLTVLDLVKKYLLQKKGVKHNTEANYKFVVNIITKEDFGRMRIDKVKPSDAKTWLIKLQELDGRGYSSIQTIRGVVRPAFQMALEDDLIRRNPFDFQLVTVVVNDSVTREALTREQERLFLKFIEEDKHFSKYYDGIYILFNTGMRISEFCGLTKNSIDLKNKTININHQLQRTRDMKYVIETPKTESGKRVISINNDVCECFRRIIENRRKPKVEPMISGKCGFLYLDKNDMPMIALHWEKYFQHIREKFNSIYKKEMPIVTPHVARHTYCSRMASSGMNPKTLQYLMGHSDIGVTLNTYTHVEFNDVQAEVEKVSKMS